MTVPTAPTFPDSFVQDVRLATSFTLDGFEMLRKAWFLDIADLLFSPDVRGNDRLLPEGITTAYPRYPKPTPLSLNLPITGTVNSSGVSASDPWLTLLANIRLLRSSACDGVRTGDGTRLGILTVPGGTYTGRITPLGLKRGEIAGPIMVAKFNLNVTDGDLTYAAGP